jgi:hypothetical protein
VILARNFSSHFFNFFIASTPKATEDRYDMAIRVSDVRHPRRTSRGFDVCEIVFTVSDARRALPYVARLLNDALLAYQQVQDARQKLLYTLSKPQQDELILQRDYAIDRLNEVIDECNAVGLAHIHIPTGKAAFYAEIAQRPVTLLWQVGEPIETAWQSLMPQDICPPAILPRMKTAAVREPVHA